MIKDKGSRVEVFSSVYQLGLEYQDISTGWYVEVVFG